MLLRMIPMSNCDSCGAGIDDGDTECPYCGASIRRITAGQKSAIRSSDSTYMVRIDDEGKASIRFGDGQTGARPTSGDVSSQYQYGAGTQGNVAASYVEEKLDSASQYLDRIPDSNKHKGTRDEGVIMIESLSALGDLLSVYQNKVSDEAHLTTEDHDRISNKEERVRRKLESMVRFCDMVDSKTKKKMGLSESDVHRIRTTARRILQASNFRTGKCSKCGTQNRPGTRKCLKCGTTL